MTRRSRTLIGVGVLGLVAVVGAWLSIQRRVEAADQYGSAGANGWRQRRPRGGHR